MTTRPGLYSSCSHSDAANKRWCLKSALEKELARLNSLHRSSLRYFLVLRSAISSVGDNAVMASFAALRYLRSHFSAVFMNCVSCSMEYSHFQMFNEILRWYFTGLENALFAWDEQRAKNYYWEYCTISL